MEESSINHMEGGWPEHVKPEMIEHRNKFIRQVSSRSWGWRTELFVQTCKEDMFKWTTARWGGGALEELDTCTQAHEEYGEGVEAEQHDEH